MEKGSTLNLLLESIVNRVLRKEYAMIIEEKIKKMGLELPESRTMINKKSLVRGVRTGNLVFLSGAGPYFEGKFKYLGKMGIELTPEEGYEAARFCALNILRALKDIIGDLDKVTQVVQVLGYVNVASEYSDEKIGYVTNGGSDLLAELYGEERGRHSRASFGVAKL
ncbi:MAG: RidA family protein, partial [Thermoplasmata archaeon]